MPELPTADCLRRGWMRRLRASPNAEGMTSPSSGNNNPCGMIKAERSGRSVLVFETFLSFHDVTYLFCWTASLCIKQLKPSVDKRNGSPDGLTPLDLR